MSPDLVTAETGGEAVGATVLRGPGLAELPVVDFVHPSTPVTGRQAGSSAAEGMPMAHGGTSRGLGTAGNSEANSEPSPDPDPASVDADADANVALDAAYRCGWAEGQAALTSAIDDAARAREALTEAMAQLRSAVETHRSTTDELAVDLAIEIARLILGREVSTAADPGRDALVRCLAEVDPASPATIRLNPTDLGALGQIEDVATGRAVELVADPAVESGDAVADLSGGRVDASVAEALLRVAKALRS